MSRGDHAQSVEEKPAIAAKGKTEKYYSAHNFTSKPEGNKVKRGERNKSLKAKS